MTTRKTLTHFVPVFWGHLNKVKISDLGGDRSLREASIQWTVDSARHEYSSHFKWMGRPIIQYPQDIVATQELIWEVKPNLIIETGIAHGGSLVLSSSILELIGWESVLLSPGLAEKKSFYLASPAENPLNQA